MYRRYVWNSIFRDINYRLKKIYHSFYYAQNDNVTVKDAKRIIYQGEENIPEKIKLGCKGRIMDDNDNLAMAVRAFCKRDPKVIIWQDEHSQYL
ncbi:hypothetical protein PFLG_02286 [Plasmodium falciparum RAJ116]|uniref:Uncharacterized protein n=1 Tax=Plasmodium falciparum RAJ116 TaxID=580058 RepID=A0A0L0CXD9_PLAFA|nr:hypothetical protein PFLG_02286 [Plasmodium falciparum RAJ116]